VVFDINEKFFGWGWAPFAAKATPFAYRAACPRKAAIDRIRKVLRHWGNVLPVGLRFGPLSSPARPLSALYGAATARPILYGNKTGETAIAGLKT